MAFSFARIRITLWFFFSSLGRGCAIGEHDQCLHYLCIAFSDLRLQKRLNGSSVLDILFKFISPFFPFGHFTHGHPWWRVALFWIHNRRNQQYFIRFDLKNHEKKQYLVNSLSQIRQIAIHSHAETVSYLNSIWQMCLLVALVQIKLCFHQFWWAVWFQTLMRMLSVETLRRICICLWQKQRFFFNNTDNDRSLKETDWPCRNTKMVNSFLITGF